MDLVLRDVRLFRGYHRLPFRALTLLVGENSSGKTTALAMLASLGRTGGLPESADFNHPPYDLGSYDNIASSTGPSSSARQFQLGYVSEREYGPRPSQREEVLATYRRRGDQPALHALTIQGPAGRIDAEFSRRSVRCRIAIAASRRFRRMGLSFEQPIPRAMSVGRSTFDHLVLNGVVRTYRTRANRMLLNAVLNIARQGALMPDAVSSLGPVRTKPRRTYDLSSAGAIEEGADAAPLLANRLGAKREQQFRHDLLHEIEGFGRDSGLFRSVTIRPLGPRSDPFQVLVSVGRQAFNLADVGYGVSQVLPIIVRSLLLHPHQTLLMQQPDVHLHPKAQAALGSFLTRIASRHHLHMAIETHSDFLIDRIRQEVARKTISADDVAILYFSRTAKAAEVSLISLDRGGNLVNAPAGYRRFFLEEETRLLGRGQR